MLFNHGHSRLNKNGYQEINLPVRIQLLSCSPDLSLERVNAIQDQSIDTKKPSACAEGFSPVFGGAGGS